MSEVEWNKKAEHPLQSQEWGFDAQGNWQWSPGDDLPF